MNRKILQYINHTLMDQLTSLLNQAKPYVQKGLQITQQGFDIAEEYIYSYKSQLRQANRFQLFLQLNLFLLKIYIIIQVLKFLNPFQLYKKITRLIFQLLFVSNKIEKDMLKVKEQVLESIPQQYRSKIKKIPYTPVQDKPPADADSQYVKGYLSGSRYPQKKHSDFVTSLSKKFSYSNPLHFDLHPYLKQMQVQIIKMCANMLHFLSDQNQAVGGIFSGGTQSILMAILAYRQYGRKYKNIKNPNIVICQTGHAAAIKAADMFQIQVRKVGSNKQYQMSVSATKSAIDSNTICVYTSYPNYPYGTVDPIDQIARHCVNKNIPIHLDMCLGGYLVPFLKNQKGQPLFTVPKGVTSVSLDCHKYGLSGKGASVLLFSSEKYRKQHIFVTKQWPGGYYGTLGIAGSRSGISLASAWISMMRMGTKGYTKNAKNVQYATKKFAQQLKLHGYKVFGNPQICCIGFSHHKFDISEFKDKMKAKGWDIPIIQLPLALHYSFTPINSLKIDQMVEDLKSVTKDLEQLYQKGAFDKKKQAECQLYGACAKIPQSGAKDKILKLVLDMFYEV